MLCLDCIYIVCIKVSWQLLLTLAHYTFSSVLITMYTIATVLVLNNVYVLGCVSGIYNVHVYICQSMVFMCKHEHVSIGVTLDCVATTIEEVLEIVRVSYNQQVEHTVEVHCTCIYTIDTCTYMLIPVGPF